MLFTEPTFLFFLYAGLYAGWLLLTRKKAAFARITGFLMGISALVHPQGFVYVGIPFAMLGLQFLIARGREERLALVRIAGWLVVAFALVIALFVVPVWMATGETPVGSKALRNLVGGEDLAGHDPQRAVQRVQSLDESGEHRAVIQEVGETSIVGYILEHPVELAGRVYRNLGRLDRDVLQQAIRPFQLSGIQTFFEVIVVLGVLGVPWRRKELGSQLYLLTILSYVIAWEALFFFHERLLLPVLPVFLIWGGVGITQLGGWIKATLKNLDVPWLRERSYALVAWLAMLVLCSVFVINYIRLKAQLIDETAIHQQSIGIWMRENLPSDIKVMTDNPFIPYYFFTGSQQCLIVPYAEYDKFIHYAHKNHVDYIVLTEWRIVGWEYPIKELFDDEIAYKDLSLVKEWEFTPGQRARLFKLESVN